MISVRRGVRRCTPLAGISDCSKSSRTRKSSRRCSRLSRNDARVPSCSPASAPQSSIAIERAIAVCASVGSLCTRAKWYSRRAFKKRRRASGLNCRGLYPGLFQGFFRSTITFRRCVFACVIPPASSGKRLASIPDRYPEHRQRRPTPANPRLSWRLPPDGGLRSSDLPGNQKTFTTGAAMSTVCLGPLPRAHAPVRLAELAARLKRGNPPRAGAHRSRLDRRQPVAREPVSNAFVRSSNQVRYRQPGWVNRFSVQPGGSSRCATDRCRS